MSLSFSFQGALASLRARDGEERRHSFCPHTPPFPWPQRDLLPFPALEDAAATAASAASHERLSRSWSGRHAKRPQLASPSTSPPPSRPRVRRARPPSRDSASDSRRMASDWASCSSSHCGPSPSRAAVPTPKATTRSTPSSLHSPRLGARGGGGASYPFLDSSCGRSASLRPKALSQSFDGLPLAAAAATAAVAGDEAFAASLEECRCLTELPRARSMRALPRSAGTGTTPAVAASRPQARTSWEEAPPAAKPKPPTPSATAEEDEDGHDGARYKMVLRALELLSRMKSDKPASQQELQQQDATSTVTPPSGCSSSRGTADDAELPDGAPTRDPFQAKSVSLTTRADAGVALLRAALQDPSPVVTGSLLDLVPKVVSRLTVPPSLRMGSTIAGGEKAATAPASAPASSNAPAPTQAAPGTPLAVRRQASGKERKEEAAQKSQSPQVATPGETTAPDGYLGENQCPNTGASTQPVKVIKQDGKVTLARGRVGDHYGGTQTTAVDSSAIRSAVSTLGAGEPAAQGHGGLPPPHCDSAASLSTSATGSLVKLGCALGAAAIAADENTMSTPEELWVRLDTLRVRLEMLPAGLSPRREAILQEAEQSMQRLQAWEAEAAYPLPPPPYALHSASIRRLALMVEDMELEYLSWARDAEASPLDPTSKQNVLAWFAAEREMVLEDMLMVGARRCAGPYMETGSGCWKFLQYGLYKTATHRCPSCSHAVKRCQADQANGVIAAAVAECGGSALVPRRRQLKFDSVPRMVIEVEARERCFAYWAGSANTYFSAYVLPSDLEVALETGCPVTVSWFDGDRRGRQVSPKQVVLCDHPWAEEVCECTSAHWDSSAGRLLPGGW